MEYIPSQKNSLKLTIDNFLFTKKADGKAEGVVIWRCEVRTCKKLVHVRNNEIIKMSPCDHNHAAVHGKALVEKVVAQMRENARTLEDPTRNIIFNNSIDIPEKYAHLAPQRDSLGRNLRNHRQRARQQRINNDPIHLTTDGEAFLRFNDNGLTIFAADEDLLFLSNCEHWFVDGTFKVTPTGYAQLYTVHGFINQQTFPCVYALLPGKSQEHYEYFLHQLLNLQFGLSPESIMMDFELAAINAFQAVFPNGITSGCYFHFGQCIWRKLQKLGMTEEYNRREEFAESVKKIMALAFLPIQDVIYHFEALVAMEEYVVLNNFIRYFEKNFIGRRSAAGNRREPARFPIALWNQYERVLNDLPRSNNAIEGWHNAFNKSVDFTHPDVAYLAKKFKAEQHSALLLRTQMNRGHPAPAKKKKYQKMNRSLRTMVSAYNGINPRIPLEYLADVARVLNINVV